MTSRADTRFKAKLRAKLHSALALECGKPDRWDEPVRIPYTLPEPDAELTRFAAKFAPHINRNIERRAVPMGMR